MLFTLLILLILLVTVIGTVAYVYLWQEQVKFIPKDKYESAISGSDLPKRLVNPSKAGFIGLVTSVVLFFLWFPAAFIMAIGLDGGSNWFIDAGGYFIGLLFLASLFLLAASLFTKHIFIVKTVLKKISQLSTHNKIIFIFCVILAAIGFSVSIYLNRGGCLWRECAPTRSFDVADLGLPSNLFPASIDVGKFYSIDDGNHQTYQNGGQEFRTSSGLGSGLVGFYSVEMYSSNKKAAQRFNSSKGGYEHLNKDATKPKDINYISPLADQFYISCGYNPLLNCVAIAQYQEFCLYLYITMRNGMTTQGFQQVVIYMDRQISKYLYEK